jgi:hypothetical protein
VWVWVSVGKRATLQIRTDTLIQNGYYLPEIVYFREKQLNQLLFDSKKKRTTERSLSIFDTLEWISQRNGFSKSKLSETNSQET